MINQLKKAIACASLPMISVERCAVEATAGAAAGAVVGAPPAPPGVSGERPNPTWVLHGLPAC